MKKSTKNYVKVEDGEGIRFRRCNGTFNMQPLGKDKWIIVLTPNAYESNLQVTAWADTGKTKKKKG